MINMLIDTIQPAKAPNIQKIKTDGTNILQLNNKNKNKSDTTPPIPIKAIDTSGKHERSVDDDELQKSIEKMLKTLEGDTTSLKFDIHKETNTIMVKVIDNDTQKVVREIPSEKILDMVASIWKLVGIIVDKKV